MFIKFHVDADSFHCYETSRPICALARLEVTFYWVNHVGWVHGSRISKDELIEVTIGLAQPLRGGDSIRCLLLSQGAGRFTM
jgi:hypothetical protein